MLGVNGALPSEHPCIGADYTSGGGIPAQF